MLGEGVNRRCREVKMGLCGDRKSDAGGRENLSRVEKLVSLTNVSAAILFTCAHVMVLNWHSQIKRDYPDSGDEVFET